jgi:hypothetical protein
MVGEIIDNAHNLIGERQDTLQQRLELLCLLDEFFNFSLQAFGWCIREKFFTPALCVNCAATGVFLPLAAPDFDMQPLDE